jgi:DNA end-binding protein Ku
MATMRFADEVVKPDELDGVIPEDVEAPKKREIDMAGALIDQLTSDFEPDQYRDEYREELLELIESKARGEKVVQSASEEPKPTKAPDLMAALEESLAAVKGEPLAAGAKSKPKSRAKKSPAKKTSTKKSPSKTTNRSRSQSKAKAAK